MANPPSQCEHRDKYVRRVTRLDRHFDDGGVALQRGDEALEHPLALDRYQGGGLPEGHPDLEASRLAGLIFFLLRQHIHAITAGTAEPPLILADHPGG